MRERKQDRGLGLREMISNQVGRKQGRGLEGREIEQLGGTEARKRFREAENDD
jgi:hypothetical protein